MESRQDLHKVLNGISAEKIQLLTNKASGSQREIKVKGQKLRTVTSFKYRGALFSDEGSKPEVLSRFAQAIAVLFGENQAECSRDVSASVKISQSYELTVFWWPWTLFQGHKAI